MDCFTYHSVTFFQLRYFLPFSTLAVPLAGVGAAACDARVSSVALRRGLRAAAALYLVACVAPALRSHRVHCEEIRALHTDVALDVARRVPPGVVVAAEAAGAMRYLGAHRVVDLYGLNYAPVAFAPDNRARTCAIARARPGLIAVPPWWEPRLRPAFELRPLQLYRVPESAIIRGGGGRAVVLQARLSVSPSGAVTNVVFSPGDVGSRTFERAARAALLQWRFPEGTGERYFVQQVRFSED